MYRTAPHKPVTWSNWVGIRVPGDASFDGGEGNAPNLNAGIGGGLAGAVKERDEGHGLCGDVATRNAFNAGKYGATDPRGTYIAGGVLETKVKLTAWHSGWFEFRLCVPEDGVGASAPVTQACLNRHVLQISPDTPEYDGGATQGKSRFDYTGLNSGSRCKVSAGHTDPTASSAHDRCTDDGCGHWPSGSCCNGGGVCSPPTENTDRWVVPKQTYNAEWTIRLLVPDGVECERCTLQWMYQTGNSLDTYPEAFWNCV